MNIHPTAILEGDIRLGSDVTVGPYVVITGNVTIGEKTKIYPFASIGANPQHRHFQNVGLPVRIGSECVIRENVTVHAGTKDATLIGDDCYLMAGVHIAHDCTLEDEITIANNTLLAGHVHIMRGANLGLNCLVHQYNVIGSYSMLGMGSIVTRKTRVTPGKTFVGNPARLARPNTVGLERFGVDDLQLSKETARFWSLLNAD